ncbi:MAG: hypothetical protein IJ446_03315 [Oscillospiraceae bacterium]|nr:hypothetical protein [Oscillospiraceae bacterium]
MPAALISVSLKIDRERLRERGVWGENRRRREMSIFAQAFLSLSSEVLPPQLKVAK